MKNVKSSVRRGFTLVELLIVIVVIGVLAAMMMLSSTEAVASAKAANIINNLVDMRKAALAYYADNMDSINADYSNWKPDLDDYRNGNRVLLYLENSGGVTGNTSGGSDKESLRKKAKALREAGYAYESGLFDKRHMRWYVSYDFSTAKTDPSIKEKILGRTKALSLLSGEAIKQNGSLDLVDTDFYDGGDKVCLRIR